MSEKKLKKHKNGSNGKDNNGVKLDKKSKVNEPHEVDPELQKKLATIRTRINQTFGQVALAMTAVPRYRHQSIGDLNHLLLDPLMHDRVAVASAKIKDGDIADTLSGIAIWASVSEEVDKKIREQVKAGVFPIRLKAGEWSSGSINWLLDVIAPNKQLTTAVIANFKQVVGEGEIRIHPMISRFLDPEDLKKMGAQRINTDSKDSKKNQQEQ